jgi:sterol 3beta-glucosyltransferase
MEKKMKILIVTIGSRGDIQPYIALADSLNKQGYSALIATHPYAKQLIKSFKVEHIPIGDNISVENEVSKVLDKAKTPMQGLYQAIDFLIKSMKSCHADLKNHVDKSDLIIVGHNLAGMAEAEILNKPFIRVAIDESGIPMVQPRFLSKEYFQGKLAAFWASAFMKPYNKFRKEIGISKLGKESKKPKLTLIPISKALQKESKLWFPPYKITGYWFCKTTLSYKPDVKIEEFIRHGSQPIFMTLGSMYSNEEDMHRILNVFIEATQICNERAIILMPKISMNNIPEHIFPIDSIAYNWLFDKVSLVVHHFGFGTTSEVLKAGLPSIPVPYIFDQHKNAKKLYKMGLSHKPLNIHKLEAKNLATVIKETKKNTDMKEKLLRIRQIIANENGLEQATELICNIKVN